jgi:valyl-tRNA synthetase
VYQVGCVYYVIYRNNQTIHKFSPYLTENILSVYKNKFRKIITVYFAAPQDTRHTEFVKAGDGRIYRVIHKFVKHFKNSQQINYATDHGNSYADKERNSPSFVYIFHRCSMYPPLVIWQTSMRWSISFHTRVSISWSTATLVTTVS